jgi:hypothetical protein
VYTSLRYLKVSRRICNLPFKNCHSVEKTLGIGWVGSEFQIFHFLEISPGVTEYFIGMSVSTSA